MRYKKSEISGRGNYPARQCYLFRPEKQSNLDECPEAKTLARGLGNNYGDKILNIDNFVVLMERLNRILAFDPEKGILKAEAGVSIRELVEVFVPRGWFLPVTPGTKFVTLGGCIASDVHGRNHHCDGTFGNHVLNLELLLANGTRVVCSPEKDAELFWATIGGMGLTGIITEVTLQLLPISSAYIHKQHNFCKNLDHLLSMLSVETRELKYSIAWIDCLAKEHQLGRSILTTGRHLDKIELAENLRNKPLDIVSRKAYKIPFHCPSFLINPLTIKAFNSIYYWSKSRRNTPAVSGIDSYFYPFDHLHQWNRCYRKKGFLQYQCVVPERRASEALSQILQKVSESNKTSSFAVVKRFGPENPGMLSFPMKGFTLAMDIPVKDEGVFRLLDRLDQTVMKYEGRVCLAKDARLHPTAFRNMYPKFNQWLEVKKRVDPEWKFSFDLSRRLHMESKS